MSFAKTRGKGTQVDNNTRISNTRLLTKIIIYLKEVKSQAIKRDFREYIGATSRLPDALNWLVSNKIICKETRSYGRSRDTYFINPEWEKLRDD